MHPQTQGKLERYHRTLKNVVKLDHYYSPEELERALKEFVHRYNYHRYHESINNVTPADAYYHRAEAVLRKREKIKQLTILKRREIYQMIDVLFKLERTKRIQDSLNCLNYSLG